MKTMIATRYTTAHTTPMLSGISGRPALQRSRPRNPLAMNAGANHRIMAYARLKARAESEMEATRGWPGSAVRVLKRTERAAAEMAKCVIVSVWERVGGSGRGILAARTLGPALVLGVFPIEDCMWPACDSSGLLPEVVIPVARHSG